MINRGFFMEFILSFERELGFEKVENQLVDKEWHGPTVVMIKKSNAHPFSEMRIRIDRIFYESVKVTMCINNNIFVSADYSLRSNYPVKLFLEVMVDKYIQLISNDLNKLIMNDKRVKI